jgi:hypothetical protein
LVRAIPGDPRKLTLHDFLPDERLRDVQNIYDFAGMLVFDKWTCNTNGRQTLFFLKNEEQGEPATLDPATENVAPFYKTVMIDQGFCFNAGEWNFPDAPLRGLYARNRVYDGVTGMESFGPWIERLNSNITAKALDEAIREIPPVWYLDEYEALLQLVERLYQRRSRVEDLLLAAKRSNRQPFPNWR